MLRAGISRWCLMAAAALHLAPAMAQWHHRRPALAAMNELVEDMQNKAPGDASEAAVRVITSLLSGLHEAGLLVTSHYNAARRSADFKLRSGGATGTVPPELMIWFIFHVSKKLHLKWEATKGGSVTMHLSGLKIWPLPNAHEFYKVAGLDGWACPQIDKSTRQEYYGCHLKKAIMLEDLWFADRAKFPKNLQTQFRQLADRELLMRLAVQLGHGFGWSMLLVLSAPPSDIHTLEFTPKGVRALTSLDQSLKGAKLAVRHNFKDLALDIARPLLGDTRFGSLIRDVGERFSRFATNFAVVLSVGEPRWRPRDLKGADPAAIADIFTPLRPCAASRSSASGCVTWRPHKEGQGHHRARGDATFALLPAPEWWMASHGAWPVADLVSRGPGAPLAAPELAPARGAGQLPGMAAAALVIVAFLALPVRGLARIRRSRTCRSVSH